MHTMFYLEIHFSPEADVCIVGNAIYNPGDSFVSSDCNSRCMCKSGKQLVCENLCPIVGITCKVDEVKKQWSEQISGSKCSCPRMKCVKKPDGNNDFYLTVYFKDLVVLFIHLKVFSKIVLVCGFFKIKSLK